MSRSPPVLVIGTPRSRTAWLAALLSTPDRIFVHEPSVHWRDLDDLRDFLDRPGAAACDSGLTLFWREALEMRPDLRLIVVQRPVEQVIASCIRAGMPVTPDSAHIIERTAAAAAEAAADWRVASCSFGYLASETVCRTLYCFALDRYPSAEWCDHWSGLNVQRDWRDQFAAAHANRSGFPRLLADRALSRQLETT